MFFISPIRAANERQLRQAAAIEIIDKKPPTWQPALLVK
jgi:hypothetical protein